MVKFLSPSLAHSGSGLSITRSMLVSDLAAVLRSIGCCVVVSFEPRRNGRVTQRSRALVIESKTAAGKMEYAWRYRQGC